jgi:hypothetical protein
VFQPRDKTGQLFRILVSGNNVCNFHLKSGLDLTDLPLPSQ